MSARNSVKVAEYLGCTMGLAVSSYQWNETPASYRAVTAVIAAAGAPASAAFRAYNVRATSLFQG